MVKSNCTLHSAFTKPDLEKCEKNAYIKITGEEESLPDVIAENSGYPSRTDRISLRDPLSTPHKNIHPGLFLSPFVHEARLFQDPLRCRVPLIVLREDRVDRESAKRQTADLFHHLRHDPFAPVA